MPADLQIVALQSFGTEGLKANNKSSSYPGRLVMKKLFCFTAITTVWLALILVPAIGQAQTVTGSCGDVLEVVDNIPAPWGDGDGIHGIAAEAGGLLYITRRDAPGSSSNNDMIYKIDGSGNELDSWVLPTSVSPPGSTTGLALYKGDLWVTNDAWDDWKICKLNLSTSLVTATYCFDINDVKSAAGCEDSTGLAFCAGVCMNAAFNWADWADSCIFRIKVAEKDDELVVKKVQTEPAYGYGPEGIDCSGGPIYHVDVASKIYRMNPKGKVTCEWDFSASFGGFLGITFDGTYYYVNDPGTIYKMQLDLAP